MMVNETAIGTNVIATVMTPLQGIGAAFSQTLYTALEDCRIVVHVNSFGQYFNTATDLDITVDPPATFGDSYTFVNFGIIGEDAASNTTIGQGSTEQVNFAQGTASPQNSNMPSSILCPAGTKIIANVKVGVTTVEWMNVTVLVFKPEVVTYDQIR